mgnify:CR=1 FL=1
MRTLDLTLTTPWLFALPLLVLPACGDDGGAYGGDGYDPGGDDDGGDEGSLGVGQGGSQDFGQFKEILDRGQIPGPNTLDDVGFFNEHKLELPKPACANDVCLHGLYGEMGNMISGSGCITLLVGMNTAIDVTKLERPPLNLSLVIDTRGSLRPKVTADALGVERRLIELEITEGVFIGDIDGARLLLDSIKQGGFKLTLDDFGSGYSSFSYLASLPLDALKVDREFVWNLGQSSRSDSVLKAIVALAQELDLELVAEGVETTEQAEWLQAAGADIAQGYFYGRPEFPEGLQKFDKFLQKKICNSKN